MAILAELLRCADIEQEETGPGIELGFEVGDTHLADGFRTRDCGCRGDRRCRGGRGRCPARSKSQSAENKNEQAQTQARTTASKVDQDKAALSRARNLLGDSGEVNVRRVAAQATLRDAELKLSYCKVYAPCDGYVTNLQITSGVYASVGEQIFSLVDREIWYVLAYFRETDLRHMRPGMAADVHFMAESGKLYHGIVQGIPKAVAELGSPSDKSPGGEGLLSQVSPTIDFILLAQRYPVRIVLDEPEEHSFRMGGTASVIVHTRSNVNAGMKRLNQLQKNEDVPFTAPIRLLKNHAGDSAVEPVSQVPVHE